MSKQYNKSVFVGHLAGEPEMRNTPAGTAVTTFNVATNDQYNNENGETVKVTTWFRCTAWGRLGEVCNQYLKTGSKVLVEGRLMPDKATGRPRIWIRHCAEARGTAAADYELKVLEIHFLDSRNNEPSIVQADPAGDDIPY